jgi:hypothetical protein
MAEVGKLFSSIIGSMFKEYLNMSGKFPPFRYHKVVGYLKKLLQKYHLLRQTQILINQNICSNITNNSTSGYSPSKNISPSKNVSLDYKQN